MIVMAGVGMIVTAGVGMIVTAVKRMAAMAVKRMAVTTDADDCCDADGTSKDETPNGASAEGGGINGSDAEGTGKGKALEPCGALGLIQPESDVDCVKLRRFSR